MINFTEVPVLCLINLRYSEVPLKGKNKTLVKILGDGQHRTTPAGQILGVATPATPAALTPMYSAIQYVYRPNECRYRVAVMCVYTVA